MLARDVQNAPGEIARPNSLTPPQSSATSAPSAASPLVETAPLFPATITKFNYDPDAAKAYQQSEAQREAASDALCKNVHGAAQPVSETPPELGTTAVPSSRTQSPLTPEQRHAIQRRIQALQEDIESKESEVRNLSFSMPDKETGIHRATPGAQHSQGGYEILIQNEKAELGELQARLY